MKENIMLTYVALLISVIALVMAWRANRSNTEVKERLAQANSRVYQLRLDNEAQQEKAEQELMTLKFELLKLQGNLKITPEMQIGEVVAAHPLAQQVLAGFHIGGCSSCSVDDRQTLGEAVAVNGRQLEPVLAALNTLVIDSANGGSILPDQLRAPNIELHF
jgi:hypothetical protein